MNRPFFAAMCHRPYPSHGPMPILIRPRSGLAGNSRAEPEVTANAAKPAAAPALMKSLRFGSETMTALFPGCTAQGTKRQTCSQVNFNEQGCVAQWESYARLLSQYRVAQVRDRVGMAVKALIGREPPGIPGKLRIGLGGHIGDRGSFHEVEDRDRRCSPRPSARRQHVIGPEHEIAERRRGVLTKQDLTRMIDAAEIL